MKRNLKSKFLSVFTASLLGFSLIGQATGHASEDIAGKCGYEPIQGKNPHYQVTNCLLTETALAYNIPPEVVKAVAHKESADWLHFDEPGKAIESFDGGIGMMQITLHEGFDKERLKNDIVYNIETGVKILDQMYKRNDLPKINNHDRDIIEHWYFAILAYNGTMPMNSPIVQSTGQRNQEAYQEGVYDIIKDRSAITLTRIPFQSSDFDYDPEVRAPINFVTKQFNTDLPLTKTTHLFKANDKVLAISEPNLREKPTASSDSLGKMQQGEVITITGDYTYDESNPVRKNHFVWYPVKRSNGTTGYVASSYLKESNQVVIPEISAFKDVPAGHWAADAIYFLSAKDVIKGYPNGNFGIKDQITRAQAATLLARSENLTTGNRPNPNFSDVPTSHPYYGAIAAVAEEGLFAGVTETEFGPEDHLTRAQMAVLLQRIYSFESRNGNHPFTDIRSGIWYEKAVNNLHTHGIVEGLSPTTFGPNEKVTRAQFATLMYRAIAGEQSAPLSK
ncbi:S-layer homology domain-containing protein [Anaerobacillus sp. MEB173]|uniref:S-layer homology domain-containing protein n=1 Tax=Anaerobacillus sp. MEB173 TaxID=3383345 RepID=UPI003F8DAC7C